jgi:hypothetical protein
MPKKNITIDDLAVRFDKTDRKIDQLAESMRVGFIKQEERLTKNIDEKIGDLAGLTKRGFDEMGERFDKVENRLNKVEQGQEDIKLRLDNVAYRFELIELQRRVTLLEKRTGFSK